MKALNVGISFLLYVVDALNFMTVSTKRWMARIVSESTKCVVFMISLTP